MRMGALIVLLLVGTVWILFREGILAWPRAEPPPRVEEAPEPPPPVVVEIPEPEPEPVMPEPEPEPPSLAEQVIECLRLQAELEVPHRLADAVDLEAGSPYAEATVVRIEPDGIHIRHPSGLEKIHFDRMPESWREVYFIHPDPAAFYQDGRQALMRQAYLDAIAAAERRRQSLQETAPRSAPSSRPIERQGPVLRRKLERAPSASP